MLTRSLVIAQKELLDAMRDVRSLLSALLYCLMGPAVVWMVSFAVRDFSAGPAYAVLTGMMSVFTLVSAFAGGTNVAMDVLAGERERRSLLPLIMNVAARRELVLGKWLAVSVFSAAGLLLNLAGFALVVEPASLLQVVSLLPLALLAAALQLAISTACRNTKEAHTYLSMLVFLPMGLGMFLVFFPRAAGSWLRVLPIIGQQWQMGVWAKGAAVPLLDGLALGLMTATITACALYLAAELLEHDDVVYGG